MAYPYTSYQNPYQQGYYPYQQMQQPQPVVQQTQQPVIPQSSIIWISGESEASMFPIAPNNAVALWEKSGKTIYLKSADATGKPTMRIYDLVERSQNASDGVSEQTTPYATKEDLATVVGVVKDFDALIGTLKSDIDSMKSDMYGIAGKKKTTRKTVQEVANDE